MTHFTPSDLLARAETADPETAAMLRQSAGHAAEVERLRGKLQAMHRRAQRAEGAVHSALFAMNQWSGNKRLRHLRSYPEFVLRTLIEVRKPLKRALSGDTTWMLRQAAKEVEMKSQERQK
jgi:hypothetical protein